MRFMWIGAALALGALACGEKKSEQPPAGEAPAQAAAQPEPTGQVIEVKMTGSGNTFQYEPAAFSVEEGIGITVRFINVSGGPHNVAFWADSIPAGAAAGLNTAMPNRMDNLAGPFLINPNDHYDIKFDGLPEGAYKGFCTPHLALGMKFTLTLK